MNKVFLALSGIVFCLFLSGVGSVSAEDADTAVGWKQVLSSDRAEIKETKEEIKENAQEAKIEEKQLRAQIMKAEKAGDLETAKKLREQLRLKHRENMQEKIQDRKEIQEEVQELRGDIKEANEKAKVYRKIDNDNNPPGPVGGAGTNWENPPGPKGGIGASPDR